MEKSTTPNKNDDGSNGEVDFGNDDEQEGDDDEDQDDNDGIDEGDDVVILMKMLMSLCVR